MINHRVLCTLTTCIARMLRTDKKIMELEEQVACDRIIRIEEEYTIILNSNNLLYYRKGELSQHGIRFPIHNFVKIVSVKSRVAYFIVTRLRLIMFNIFSKYGYQLLAAPAVACSASHSQKPRSPPAALSIFFSNSLAAHSH